MNTGVIFFLLVVYFAIGWQIGGIDLVALTTQADDAAPALSKVLWPWQRAITYPETLLVGKAQVLSPCGDEEFPETEPLKDEPYILSSPTCGNPSEQGGQEGTTFTLTGMGFAPDTETEIWWEDPIGNEFRQRQGGEYVKVMTDGEGTFNVDIIMPYRLLPPSAGEGPKIWEVQGRQVAAVGAPVLSTELKLAVEKMVETIFIGMMATFFGIIMALPISFLAARNLMSMSPVTIAIYYLVRTIMNIVRSIEPLIWAIIAVIVVGLGPFAGILALTLHSMAALGKLYSESIESIDPGPIEAVQATGANWLQVVMYAVVPQVIPPFVSFTIYRWDINIRMSTIIGFVGGGGIGFLLAQWIRLLDYSAAGIAVWFIALTVAVLDYVSAEIRAWFI
jgi:phosphonate transport system permease protein